MLACLWQVAWLRTCALAAQVLVIGIAWAADLAVHYTGMLGIVAAMAILNALLMHRLRHDPPRVGYGELFVHQVLDLLAFTGLLLLSGGSANPFIVLYFLYVALLAFTLPVRFVTIGTLLTVVFYALTAQFATPLVLRNGGDVPAALFSAAQWVSFGLAAAMVVWFVVRGRNAVAEQRRQLDDAARKARDDATMLHLGNVVLSNQRRLIEDAARKAHNDAALMRIGTIAAGAAHELGSPLMSMGIIVREWQRTGVGKEIARDVDLLATQIDACKDALGQLRTAAKSARREDVPEQPVDAYLTGVAQRCAGLRPEVDVQCDFAGPSSASAIAPDPSLQQAILVLLDNAADVSPRDVHMRARWDAEAVEIAIEDRGPGIPTRRLADIGQTFFTTKAGNGNGLGVMLTTATIARLGGHVTWSNRPDGGACATLRIPFSRLQRKTKAEAE